jgi:BASS family bile acid:Na+ symporter
VVDFGTILGVGAPALAFTTLLTVGLEVAPSDFVRLRSAPAVVVAGLLAPLVVLPAIALALVWWFAPDASVAAGLLLVAACPIGGISNTYSYLARASTALSVTLTGLSGILAVAAIPLLSGLFERVLHEPLQVDAPVPIIALQLVFMLAVPVGIGMAIRRRWPEWAQRRRVRFQQLAWMLLLLLLLLVFAIEAERVAAMLGDVVLLAAVFVSASFGAGWVVGTVVRASDADRFTLSAEFATRNIAVATAIAVTMLGRTEFALFGSIYFLTELPLMLAAVAAWRWRQARAATSSRPGLE